MFNQLSGFPPDQNKNSVAKTTRNPPYPIARRTSHSQIPLPAFPIVVVMTVSWTKKFRIVVVNDG